MNMKVILKDDILHLGREGEVKQVSIGYARNYLFPRGLAIEATESALKGWEKGRAKREKIFASKLEESKSLAQKLSEVSLSFSHPASPEGRLFGSVGKTEIVKSLKTCGYSVKKESVMIDSPFKAVGSYEVPLRLLSDVTAKIKVTVTARE